MKEIEKYIQFAIDNFNNSNGELALGGIGKIKNIDHNWLLHYESFGHGTGEDAPTGLWIPLHTLITSKPFIEAVARGLMRKPGNQVHPAEEYEYENHVFDEFTKNQAIAIRDEKLEEFIINLLGE